MTAVPDKGTCQLEQTEVIGWLLIVAHQYRPAFGQPAQGAFHHPPPGRVGLLARLVQFLFANTPDLRLVSGVGDGSVACGVVIPLVQAQVLDAFRPVHPYALQRRLKEFRVVDISSGHHHAQWSADPVDQDAFLASCLPTVRGIASNSAPPKRAFPMEQSADCHSQSTPSNSRHSSIRAGPDTLNHATFDPTLEGPVDGAVIPQLPGQAVPLAGTAHAEDDALQHPSLVHPIAPLPLGGVQLQNHRFNSLPQIIGYFPYSGQSIALSHHPPPHSFPLSYPNRLWILHFRPILI